MKLLQKINVSWRKIRRRRRLKSVIRIESRDDLPRKLGAAVYIVGGEIPKWVVLECPCRCGQERIDVNLMHARRPCVGTLLRSMAKLRSNLHCGCLRKNAEVTLGSERTGLSGFSRAIFEEWGLAIPGPASKILRHTTSTVVQQ